MEAIRSIHALFGERILPLLIVIGAIWFTVAWKPGARNPAARVLAILVDIQATLGLLYFIYGIVVAGGSLGAKLLSFPFLLHPLIGLIAAGVGHMAVRPDGPFGRLGRWSALAGLGVLLLLVVINIIIATRAA